ncbi:tetratricopeptide repeat protein [Paenibacillus zeisoli]|nr:hypothetical protein [Paenibacillus zeisoli]
MMFQHVFAEMNHMLEEIAEMYPIAKGSQKQELGKKWQMLKAMSDGIIEEWLSFEERMSDVRKSWGLTDSVQQVELPEMKSGTFIKGQGYYKLKMYSHAAEQFKRTTEEFQDSLLARIYLAMSYLNMNDTREAGRHFQWVLPLTDNKRLRSIIYNALGCIEATHDHMDKAQEYFTLAHHIDPTFIEPLNNLDVCQQKRGSLQFGSQLASLM